ncbi:MAG: hypothetical protein LUG55_06400 [Clostridiales bacterium]|nr:hypothetical protein [Clostridiales bacterium]
MAIQPAICSHCGGKIKVDDLDLNGFGECEFCHTPYKVIDVITIDGLPTARSLLASAQAAVENENPEKAVKLYYQIIDIKPNCHEAWWGLYVCNAYFDAYYQYRDKYGNSGPLTRAAIMQNTISKYANRAIQYAPEDIAEQYRQAIAENIQFIQAAKNGDFDQKDNNGSSGCYIATAVYGSYDCNEVFALRRFRDEYLSKTFCGRIFIRIYYRISPWLARRLPPESQASNLIRKALDKLVERI